MDANIGDLDAWQRLAELTTEGNRLYTRVQRKGELGRLFVRPEEVRGKLLATLGEKISVACGSSRGGGSELTPLIALDVEHIGNRIPHL